jgi:plastocyanin
MVSGALAAPASADPGHASYTVAISFYEFNPTPVTITEGHIIQWNWDGPDTGHSVTSDAGSGETFDSGVRNGVGATFEYYFGKAGTYKYHCKTHDSMRGTIVVEPGPTTDQKAPKVGRVRGSVARGFAVVRFRVSENAAVTARVRRRGASKVLKSSFRFVRAGKARTKVRLPGRGRFRVALVVEDDAGNKAHAAVAVRR